MPPLPAPYHQCHGVIRTGHSLIGVVEYDQAGVAYAWTSVSKQSFEPFERRIRIAIGQSRRKEGFEIHGALERRHHAFAPTGRGMDISRSEHVEFAAGACILQMVMPDERSHID